MSEETNGPRRYTPLEERMLQDGIPPDDVFDHPVPYELNRHEDPLREFHNVSSHNTINEAILGLCRRADEAGMDEETVWKVFTTPLPKNKEVAESELKERLRKLCVEIRRLEEVQESKSLRVQSDELYQAIVDCHILNDEVIKMKKLLIKYLEVRENSTVEEFPSFKKYPDYFGEVRTLQEIIGDWESMVGDTFTRLMQMTDWGHKIIEFIKEDSDALLTDIQISESDRQLAEEVISRMVTMKFKVEFHVLKHLPKYRKYYMELKAIQRSLGIFKKLDRVSWDNEFAKTESLKLDIPDEHKENSILLKIIALLGNEGVCSVSELANLWVKMKDESKALPGAAAQAKLVKRNFRGLKPIGNAGEDYTVIEAGESHVKDKTAWRIGCRIYGLVKGRTKFHINDVVDYFISKRSAMVAARLLKKELGHTPTAEEVGHEMGIDPKRVAMYVDLD